MKVFAINGIGLAGKDSFVDRVEEALGERIGKYSTIDPVKALYTDMGWTGEKTPLHRKALNTLKNTWVELNDGPTEIVKDLIRKDFQNQVPIAFVMVREFFEMMKIVEWGNREFGFAQTIEVVRDGLDVPSVEVEFLKQHPKDYRYNWRVNNKTTIDPKLTELAKSAAIFIKRVIDSRSPGYFHSLGAEVDLSEYRYIREFEVRA